MAPKKKASRDSSATAGSKTKAKWQPTVPSGAPILPRRKGGRAIACRVRGITWGALDFTVVVDAEQPLFDVVERIVAQHGGAVHADTLVLYRGDPPLSAPLSAELGRPLGDLEAGGALELRYDFVGTAMDCPLALREPSHFGTAAGTNSAKESRRSSVVRSREPRPSSAMSAVSDRPSSRASASDRPSSRASVVDRPSSRASRSKSLPARAGGYAPYLSRYR
uniref:Uncharacterized protein n=1 Tax=Emiliania huxleyi TaxID=2903 RepID=A0A7S3RQM7_EMIHU|mmetsp:Transcript_5939/g.17227  ORF Transcript_5939/g.17227 Transcript_5939/m.17227 type:complete len:222 (+) Transcript_5939:39-704(+)